MSNSSGERITDYAPFFLEASNPTHRQYEALRAYFVDHLPSQQVAQRFGYTQGSFRVLCHQFRQDPRRKFFLSPQKGPHAAPKKDHLRDEIIAMRKQNLSIYDIHDALQRSEHALSPAAISIILKEEGFARLPRRRDGFIPLTDCASVVMADKLGLYKQYGLNVEVTKEASWANIRDKLLVGELQAAHCLFGMPFSVYTGVGGTAGKELKIAMVLNANGQAITLAKELVEYAGYAKIEGVQAAVEALRAKKEPTFAMTFPGGTHDMWLRYWLAAGGIDQNSVKIVTIPPPQMVANMKVNSMDGFCVGEPWPGVAAKDDVGYTHIATQDIWKDHPEKALVANAEFAAKRRNDLKKVMRAVLEASIWLDKIENRAEAADVISAQAYVNAPVEVLGGRLTGKYDLGAGLGEKVFTDDYMLYHKDGMVNFPRKSYGIWFMNQYVRFGYLKNAPDYQAIADKLIMQDLYKEAAGELNIALPDDDMQSFTVKLDNTTFDPVNPTVI